MRYPSLNKFIEKETYKRSVFRKAAIYRVYSKALYMNVSYFSNILNVVRRKSLNLYSGNNNNNSQMYFRLKSSLDMFYL